MDFAGKREGGEGGEEILVARVKGLLVTMGQGVSCSRV